MNDDEDALTQLCRQYVHRGQCPRMMNMEKVVGKELFGQVIHSDDDFASLFLKYGKVAVVPGGGFGAPNFIRWSYAASMDNIKAGLDRLEMFLQGKAV